MRIEEGNVGRLEDISPGEFNRGICTYKSQYMIIDLQSISKSDLERIVSHSKKNLSALPNIQRGKYLVLKDYGPLSGINYDRSFFNTLEEVINAMKGKLNESIKDKIRTALKEDSVAKKSTRWNPDTQPNIYQLDIFLRKSGYRLVDVVNNEGKPEPIIEAMKEGHLHPDITYSVADQTFYTSVKKYGELVVSDLEEVIKGYETALGVVKHLENLDLFKLEFREESEDEE